MSDEPYDKTLAPTPGPWGTRRLGDAGGLHMPEEPPRLTPMASVEGRITRLEGAAVAAFVFLLLAMTAGFFRLTDAATESDKAMAARLERIDATLGEIRTDVAILKERTPATAP